MAVDHWAVSELEASLGLRFNDRGLLRQALVHRSFLNEQGGSPLDSYERMEFLGDAVLELVVSTELYRNLPRVTEGELTKGRSALVCRSSLARAARRRSLGQYLALGRGERDSGGGQRESILEEAFESVVAAVYLDQGYDAARRFILDSLEPELSDYCRRGTMPENPKSLLQETLQGRGFATPRYQVVAVDGPAHQPVFTVEVRVGGEVLARGSGGKKVEAEQDAARQALALIAQQPPGGAGSSQRRPAGSHQSKSGRQAELCSHSSNAIEKPTRNKLRRRSNAAGNAGSGASSRFSAPLNWMRGLGRSWRKS